MKTGKRILIVCVSIVVLGLLAWSMNKPDVKAGGDNALELRAPEFVSVAHAAPAEAEDNGTSFLDDEAGIAAYTQTPWAIDLASIRDLFRTIEYESDSYIIGSVELADYPETHDVHVYVHADGWVVGYYLAEDPTSKIVDLRHYDGETIETTKLEIAVGTICTGVGATPFEVDYYDFRYPNASHLMLITERYGGAENSTFEVQISPEYTMYERSWAHVYYDCERYGSWSTFYLDDVQISAQKGAYCWHFAHNSFSLAQLPPGSFHALEVISGCGDNAYIALSLTYQENAQ